MKSDSDLMFSAIIFAENISHLGFIGYNKEERALKVLGRVNTS